MAAYAIAALTAHNNDWQQEYGARMPALVQKHGGKLLAKAQPQVLEGEPPVPGLAIVLEFPSDAHAQAWFADPEHEPLRQLRRAGADFNMVLVPGV